MGQETQTLRHGWWSSRNSRLTLAVYSAVQWACRLQTHNYAWQQNFLAFANAARQWLDISEMWKTANSTLQPSIYFQSLFRLKLSDFFYRNVNNLQDYDRVQYIKIRNDTVFGNCIDDWATFHYRGNNIGTFYMYEIHYYRRTLCLCWRLCTRWALATLIFK